MGFDPVDFQCPVTTLWVVGVLVVVALLMIGHGLWRRRRQLRYARRTQRNPDPNLVRDTRIEQRVGYACLGGSVVLAGFAVWGAWQTHQNVRSNLAEKYGVTQVENDRWSGSNLTADLSMPDGSVLRDETVYFEPDGEPLIGEDIFSVIPGM